MRRLGCVIVLAVAMVGCGQSANGSRTQSPGAALMAAVSRLQSTSASTVHTNGVMSVATFGPMVTSGDEQFSPAQAWDFKVTAPSGAPVALETIFVDNTLYENFGPSLAEATGGKPWLKVNLTLGSLAGMPSNTAPLNLNQSVDPAQQVKLLLTSSNLKEVGKQTVDGTRATHYAGDVNPATMLQAAPFNLSPDQVTQLKGMLQQAGMSSEHIDLWLRDDGLPVELKASATIRAIGKVGTDDHYSKWGEPVNITAPPADQVWTSHS